MTTTAAPRWDLTPIYGGLDARGFTDDLERVFADVDRLAARYDELDIRGCVPRPVEERDREHLVEVIAVTNDLHRRLRRVNTFLYGLITTDSRDEHAAALTVELQSRTAALGPLSKRLAQWLAALGVDDLVAGSELATEHRYTLDTLVESADLQMSEAEESLAAALGPSGGLAWARLHGDVSSQLLVVMEFADGHQETVPMAAARGMATHPDANRRRSAYEGELAAWSTVEVPLAAALNGAKGELAVLNRRRGWREDLDPALRLNSVDRDTLDAMTAAVVASLPDFRRYFTAKARALGHDGGLPWWDLFAPIGAAAEVDWNAATALVREAFASFSPELVELAERAFAERWIDAEVRDGKRGGAYCAGVEADVSRIMMNFDGSADSVSTLAHELGHAFHNVALAERTPLQQRTPMALAETASIFCETLLFEHARRSSGNPSQRLALLDTNLVGSSQVVVDIHSRFLFESELCKRRRRTALSPNELSTIMLDAQEAAYGDGLHPEHRHRYMWAVKPHYFTPFYNWPYTYGLLFGLGLYARYEQARDSFVSGYGGLLSSTGMADAASLAARFAIDVRDQRFWDSSLDVIRGQIDDYVGLVETLAGR
jgi:oligoendopeptidase F